MSLNTAIHLLESARNLISNTVLLEIMRVSHLKFSEMMHSLQWVSSLNTISIKSISISVAPHTLIQKVLFMATGKPLTSDGCLMVMSFSRFWLDKNYPDL